jgi:hypothetical protein
MSVMERLFPLCFVGGPGQATVITCQSSDGDNKPDGGDLGKRASRSGMRARTLDGGEREFRKL